MIIQRQTKIIEYLRDKGSATIEELCAAFKVSKNTIRRDISALDDMGVLRKVYGGAVYIEKENVIPLSVREREHPGCKELIGKAAACLVDDNDIITIDSGSTTVHMVKYLKDKRNITIITNSISVVNEAYEYNNLNVILTGGNLLRDTNSLAGVDSIDVIKRLNSKTAFMAATGISITRGITNSSMIEAEIKRAMIKTAQRTVLMADSSKFDVISLVTFCEIDEVDMVITDKGINPEYIEFFTKNGIELYIAEEE